MNRDRRLHSTFRLSRLGRSDAARWLAIVLFAPLLVLGVFGGAQFLTHGHAQSGLHLHPVVAIEGGGLVMADRSCHEGHTHAPLPVAADCAGGANHAGHAHAISDNDCHEPRPVHGVILSWPELEHLLSRGVDLGDLLCAVPVYIPAIFVLPSLSDDAAIVWIKSPGPSSHGPASLCALSARDRLVRTSTALLL